MRELVSRYSHPTRKSALRCTTSSTTLSSSVALSQDISPSRRRTPPDFHHISPLVSQANLAHLRQTCQLDSEVVPDTSRNIEPPAASASSATSSLAQQEREFQKAVQPGSPISALLSSARQPLMVAPAGGAAICGEPTLLRKLQAMKEAAKSLAKVNKVRSRLQGIAGVPITAPAPIAMPAPCALHVRSVRPFATMTLAILRGCDNMLPNTPA